MNPFAVDLERERIDYAAIWDAAEAEYVALVNRHGRLIEPLGWDRCHPSVRKVFGANMRRYGHPWRRPDLKSAG